MEEEAIKRRERLAALKKSQSSGNTADVSVDSTTVSSEENLKSFPKYDLLVSCSFYIQVFLTRFFPDQNFEVIYRKQRN